jgi:hypothetical protein
MHGVVYVDGIDSANLVKPHRDGFACFPIDVGDIACAEYDV